MVRGRSGAPRAFCRKLLGLGKSRTVWAQLTCSLCLSPQPAGTHGTCIFGSLCWEDALHLAQLGFAASNGQLGETWPLSAVGLPTPYSQREVVLRPNFLWYVSAQNRTVRSDSLKSFWTTGAYWARSDNLEEPSGPPWKGLPRAAAVAFWPTALPLSHPGVLAWQRWCAALCACSMSIALSRPWGGSSISADWVNIC